MLTKIQNAQLRDLVLAGIISRSEADALTAAWEEAENWISIKEAHEICEKHVQTIHGYILREDVRVPIARSYRSILVHLPSLNKLWDK